MRNTHSIYSTFVSWPTEVDCSHMRLSQHTDLKSQSSGKLLECRSDACSWTSERTIDFFVSVTPCPWNWSDLNNLCLISITEFIGFKSWISKPLDWLPLPPFHFSRKWLCLGFHSWRAILGRDCFHLLYFKITKAFLVIFGFAIQSSLCFTKTIKPTLSKNAVLSKMDSGLLGEQKGWSQRVL